MHESGTLTARSVARWGGFVLVEGGLTAVFGPYTAIVFGLLLLVYGFSDHAIVQRLLNVMHLNLKGGDDSNDNSPSEMGLWRRING